MLHHSDCVMLWQRIHSSARLLQSPSLVAIGLSVGHETWPPVGWHHPFVIGLSKYRLGLPSAPMHYGLTWPVGIPTVFQTPVTVPLHCPNSRQLPAVQWDCERFTAGLLTAAGNCIKYLTEVVFFIITKNGIHVKKCVKFSNWTKVDCSSFRNDQNAKISNWVIMRIFNELWCWFSKASKVLPPWTCIKNMRSINKTFFYLSRKRCLLNEHS